MESSLQATRTGSFCSRKHLKYHGLERVSICVVSHNSCCCCSRDSSNSNSSSIGGTNRIDGGGGGSSASIVDVVAAAAGDDDDDDNDNAINTIDVDIILVSVVAADDVAVVFAAA